MALNIDPPQAVFPAGGGTATHVLTNLTQARHGFKVKTSNNEHYRVQPVYGFIDPGQEVPIDIKRLPGPPREDKFVIQWAEVPQKKPILRLRSSWC
uniref:MSP domain-containing protein n=1 Tax=Ditylenchus dipsaci TaxID=166011 RepID=A0A915DRM7_9BILA